MRRHFHRLSGAVGLAVAVLLLAEATAAAPYANPYLLIETDELARLLGSPDLRIVHLRRGAKKRGAKKRKAAYQGGHIPGAVYLTPRDLDDPKANAEGFPISRPTLLDGLALGPRLSSVAQPKPYPIPARPGRHGLALQCS